MKKLLVAVVLLAVLCPALVFATTFPIVSTSTGTTTGYFKPLPGNATSFAPGYEIVTPALAQNDSCIVYLPFAGAGMYYLGWDNDGSVATGALSICFDANTAADSVACTPGIGQRVGGSFTTPLSTGLQALTCKGTTTPCVQVMTATAATWTPGALFRCAFKVKGTALAAGTKIVVRFPRERIPGK